MEFLFRTKRTPLGNFGHNGMSRAIQSMDGLDQTAKGVLGRMVAAVQEFTEPLKYSMYSLTGTRKVLEGSLTLSIVQADVGVVRYQGYSALKDDISAMNKNISGSIFAETYSGILESSLDSTEVLGELLGSTSLKSNTSNTSFATGNHIGAQLREVAKLISVDTKNFVNERAAFVGG